MSKLFRSPWVFPISTPPIKDGIVEIDAQGTIISVDSAAAYGSRQAEYIEGAIVPGFINAHCHLELSHLINKIETGTGLLHFIGKVVKLRDFPPSVIQEAMKKADQAMFHAGIVAVGDISNTADSFAVKRDSQILYYTFLEHFDLLQDRDAQDHIQVGAQLSAVCPKPFSCVPHAPYSVSDTLFELLKPDEVDISVSIHNQETAAEDEFISEHKGDFLSFYQRLGLGVSDYEGTDYDSSIDRAMQFMSPDVRTLFVHNTMATAATIRRAQFWSSNLYWVTCPNANLYIENRLPNYDVFLAENGTMCIGTDSLTSNWQLSILEEMKTILKLQSGIHFEEVLSWATINGARALGMDDRLGSIVPGKQPGLVQLTGLSDGKILSNRARSERIA